MSSNSTLKDDRKSHVENIFRCREQSESRKDTAGVGEDARGQRSKALYQSFHVGWERQKSPRRRRNERSSRIEASRGQESRANGSEMGRGRTLAGSFYG